MRRPAAPGVQNSMRPTRSISPAGANTSVEPGVTQANDAECTWVEQALDGAPEAFGQLMAQYEPSVYAYLLSRTRDRELAQELAQEAFVRAFEALERFDRKQRFLQWVLGIAHHVWSEARRRRERQQRGLEVLGADQRAREYTEVLAPEEEAVSTRILSAIEDCPERYRLPLLMRYLERMTFEEIAQQLDLSPGQVKGILYRGKQLLREKLADLFPHGRGGVES